ncbi:MAG TPA: CHAT domain-containing tetratricopeptide repeat protein [Pyrinomonadaceae bacterium]|nr:CHAT domain-containing tetratricopeptide repeat protein [Pyrinomonadaceae bacterium]
MSPITEPERQELTVPQSPQLAEILRLSNEAVGLYRQGKYTEGIPIAERAQSLAEKALGPVNLDVAITIINLASLYTGLGDYKRAEPLYQRVLSIRTQLQGPEHPDVAFVLTLLGDLYQLSGDYSRADVVLQQSLSILEKRLGPDHPKLNSTLNSLGLLRVKQGDFTSAAAFFRRGLAITERTFGPTNPTVAVWLNNLGQVYYERQEFSEAGQLLERALAIRERVFGPEHPSLVASLSNLAEIYRLKGEYRRAEPLYQRAIMIEQKNFRVDRPELATTFNDLGRLYYDEGDFDKAEALYLRAFEIRQRVLGLEHPDVAMTMFNLALLAAAKGDYGYAVGLHKKALEIREKALGPDHPLVAQSLNMLGNLEREQAKYDEAIPLLQRSLAIYEKKFGTDSANVVGALTSLAVLWLEKGDLRQAEPIAQRALLVGERTFGPEHTEVATAVGNLGLIYSYRGESAKAESCLKRALAIDERVLGPHHPNVALLLGNLAGLYERAGDIRNAVTFLGRALDVRENNLSLISISGSDRDKRLYLDTLLSEIYAAISLHARTSPPDNAAARLALDTVLRHKGRALDAMSLAIQSLRRSGSEETNALLDQLSATQSELSKLEFGGLRGMKLEDHRNAIFHLKLQAEQLQDLISRKSVQFKLQAEPVTSEQIAQALPKSSVLIEFFLYKPFNNNATPKRERFGAARYVAYVLSGSGTFDCVELGEAETIDREIQKLRIALRNPDSEQDVQPIARHVDSLIMQPIRRLLGSARMIFLSPDGALNLIPFGALVDENGHYLIEHYQFVYLTSGRDLLRIREHFPTRDRSIVMGDPDFDEAEPKTERATKATKGKLSRDFDLRFTRLGGTATEARAIGTLLGVEPLLQKEATEKRVKDAHGPQILHIATHGFLLPNKPARSIAVQPILPVGDFSKDMIGIGEIDDPLLRSGIALSGANYLQGGDGEDGILTALEVSGLDLWGTKLVVLSACETGLGDVHNGEGVYGLRRALVLAGAETQLMSLWKVDDDATKELMVNFYKRLKRGEGRGEALRNVQMEMLRSKTRRYPYFWAAFIQSGNWMSLEEEKPSR